MTAPKLYVVIGLILAFGLLFGIVAYAENTSPQMMIRFSAPVHIPGQVLPARTYLLKCTNLDESVVRIFNADGTRLYATLQAIPAGRSITDEDLVITVAAPDSDSPNFLVKWFYPGSLVGRELV